MEKFWLANSHLTAPFSVATAFKQANSKKNLIISDIDIDILARQMASKCEMIPFDSHDYVDSHFIIQYLRVVFERIKAPLMKK